MIDSYVTFEKERISVMKITQNQLLNF